MAISDLINGAEPTAKPLWRPGQAQLEAGEHYSPLPDKAEDGEVTAHAVQSILAQPDALYALWRDVALIPRWQEYVVSVTAVDRNLSHWVMGDPEEAKGERLEFDSEIVDDQPGRGFGWRSVTHGVDQAGSVSFSPHPSGRGTIVTLIQTQKIPGGGLVAKLAGLAKRSPKQIVIEDLRHFKQLAETGEIPSVKGQPHGPRGISGGIKEWLYGENNPTPPGTSQEP